MPQHLFADYDQGNPSVIVSVVSGSINTTSSVDLPTGIHNVSSYAANQTNTSLYQPSGAAKKFVVTDIIINAYTAGTIWLYDQTDAVANYLTPVLNLSANGGAVVNYKKPFVSAAANNTLRVASGNGSTGSIFVQGYEQ